MAAVKKRNVRDAGTGRYTTEADAKARPAQTVRESAPVELRWEAAPTVDLGVVVRAYEGRRRVLSITLPPAAVDAILVAV